MHVKKCLLDEAATMAFARSLAPLISKKCLIFLEGCLGAGKTTFSRGLLRGFGHTGSVKSPTFTIVEPYKIGHHQIYHFDLYRLSDPEELEYLGMEEYLEDGHVCLIEWAEKGERFLPQCDLKINLKVDGISRIVTVQGMTEYGNGLCQALKQKNTDGLQS